MSQSPFPGPIAPENNPPIHPEYYLPREFTISNINLGKTTTVTTSVDHDYVIGQLVRLIIPSTYGSFQLNETQAFVIAIPAPNMVILNLDSAQNVNAFIPNPSYGPTPPQILAIGDVNTGAINPNGPRNQGTFIPGSFINISPL